MFPCQQDFGSDGQKLGLTRRPLDGRSTGVTENGGVCASSSRATEAGGQLFGSITAELIEVIEATGPYTGDERSRHRYRSNPSAAQRASQEQSQAVLLYLGEWHTHAKDLPGASGLDDHAMQLMLARSQLNSNALLMLTVGRMETVAGLAL